MPIPYSNAYSPLIWQNAKTPLNADNLNRLEDRVEDIHEYLDSIKRGMVIGKGSIIGDCKSEQIPSDLSDLYLGVYSGSISIAEIYEKHISLFKQDNEDPLIDINFEDKSLSLNHLQSLYFGENKIISINSDDSVDISPIAINYRTIKTNKNNIILGERKKPGEGFPSNLLTQELLDTYTTTSTSETQTNAVIVSGAASNLILGTGVGNMIFGSNCLINTVKEVENSKHIGIGCYNYIVGGDACAILDNAHECVVGGKGHIATGYRSTIFGEYNKDGGYNIPTVLGVGNIAKANYQTLLGTYANPTKDTLLALGNGTGDSDAERSNAVNILADGSVSLASSIVGIKGFYWSSIDVKNKKITLSSVNGDFGIAQDFDIRNYWSDGDIISIHSDQKWTNCSKIKIISSNVITVDSLPFTSPKIESEHITDQAVYVIEKPNAGINDFGQYSYAFGENNKALNYCTFTAGRDNTVTDQYGVVFGRNNIGDYACFVAGRNNIVSQEFGFTAGSNNYIDTKQAGSFGKANFIIGNAIRAVAFGAYNSIGGDTSALRKNTTIIPQAVENDKEYSNQYNGQYGVALGYGNDIRGFCGVGIGDKNAVHGKNAVGIGRNNTISAENAIGIGDGNTLSVSNSGILGSWNNVTGDSAQALIFGTNHKITAGRHYTVFGNGNKIGINGKDSNGNEIWSNSAIGFYTIVGGCDNEIASTCHQGTIFGKAHVASGSRPTIFGQCNEDKGKENVTLFGCYNYATANHQTVIGKYAIPSSNSLFTVGNGNGTDTKRSNAFEVLYTKEESSIKTSIKIGNTVITEEQLQNLLTLISAE
jgi:hypothetical protein